MTFTALAIYPQTLRDPTEVLARARDNMIERGKRLPNYTCIQTINREYFVRSKPELPRPSCDQMSAESQKKPLSSSKRHRPAAARREGFWQYRDRFVGRGQPVRFARAV